MREKPIVKLYQQRRARLKIVKSTLELQGRAHNPLSKLGAKVLGNFAELAYAHTEGQLSRHSDMATLAQLTEGEFNLSAPDITSPLDLEE